MIDDELTDAELTDEKPADAELTDAELTDDERLEAEALRALLAGEPSGASAETLETVGVLQQAAGGVAQSHAEADAAWHRIAAATPAPAPQMRWQWLGYAVAASVVLMLLLRAPTPPPPPAGPSAADRQAAIAALDPASGAPMERLARLHRVAAGERTRLVAELSR